MSRLLTFFRLIFLTIARAIYLPSRPVYRLEQEIGRCNHALIEPETVDSITCYRAIIPTHGTRTYNEEEIGIDIP